MARPLERKTKKGGKLYRRPQKIETLIDGAVTQDASEIRRRAKITDAASPDYLPEECLVHLIREGFRNHNNDHASFLFGILLGRCESNLKRTVAHQLPNAETIREMIISDISEKFAFDVATPGGVELDFFECRFRRGFRMLRINRVKAETTYYEDLAPLPVEADEEGHENEEETLARLSSAARNPATQEVDADRKKAEDAVWRLPADVRRAFVLCRVYGYEEESKNPKKRTAATICGCTGRTIRNRLARADELLKRFKEE